ncbi:hypothetical protein JCM10207_004449 [Rhodosporidiobolus poonsookiae]
MQVDPTPSTSAQPDAAPAQKPEDVALGVYAASVFDILAIWPAVRIAIEQGGWRTDEAQLAKSHICEDIADLVYSYATDEARARPGQTTSTSTHEGAIPVPPLDELEQTLMHVVPAELEMDLEDGSEVQVAKDLLALWRERLQLAQAGQPDGEGPVATAFKQAADKARSGQQRVQAQRQGGGDEDSGSDDEDYSDDEEMGELVDASGQEGATKAPQPPQRQEPVVDEDGFEMVQPKKKGGRR